MNWVDLAILIIVFLFAIEGIRRGFFTQLFDIFSFFISLIASLIFYPQAAILLIKLFNLPKIAANPVGFLIVWVIVEITFSALFEFVFKKYLVRFKETRLNRYFGFIPATVSAFLFLSFALMFVVSLPLRPDIKKDVFTSKVGSFLVQKSTYFERPLSSIFGPIAKQSLTFLTINPKETGSIKLEFTQSEHSIDYVGEKTMFDLVNNERIKFGAEPLTWDESLSIVGQLHSTDMLERGYFSHYSPEGKDVGDRLDKASIDYLAAGENLALAPDVNRAHVGLMNSEGHRHNILDPTFTKIGIGAIDGGVYGIMFTQVFTN